MKSGELKPWPRINCHKCGGFVGKNGNLDVHEVDNGVFEEGYPECRKCLNTRPQKETNEEM